MMNLNGYALAVALAATLFDPAVALEPIEEWPVEGKLIGKSDKATGEVKKSVDISGIACASGDDFPRRCLVVDDELQDAQFVELREGELIAGIPVHLIDDAADGKPLSLDGEGVAFADGYFYVIGSHGHPRRSKKDIRAKIDASSKIIRFQDTGDDPNIQVSRMLKSFLAAEPSLQAFVDAPLDQNGVTIEGVAVANDRLYAGFRGPSVEGNRAAILSVNIGALFGDNDHDEPHLALIELGEGRGVRDLTPYRDGFLVLAGPTGEDGDYTVFWWDGRGEKVTELGDLDFEVNTEKPKKPEGIVALDERGKNLRILVMFDGKGAKEGDPATFEIKLPP